MKKLMVYGTLAATSIALIGCGGGGDNSNVAPSNTTATIKVKNSSDFDFDRVTVVSDAGAVLFDNKISCKAGSEACYVYTTHQLTNDSVNILFKDNNGRLVRFYDVDRSLPVYLNIEPTSWMLGVHLTDEIVRNNNGNGDFGWLDTNLRLSTFFKNYESEDGKIDEFEELGNYYSYKLSVSPSVDEINFISTISPRLKNWEVATNADLPLIKIAMYNNMKKSYAWILDNIVNQNFGAMGIAYANSNNDPGTYCSDGVSYFLGVVANFASYVPIVGDAVAGTASIAGDACSDDSNRWSKLFTALDTLQKSINNVAKETADIKGFLADKEISQKQEAFLRIVGHGNYGSSDNSNLVQIRADYETFLKDNGNAKSLLEYVDSKGSFAAAKLNADGTANNLDELLRIPMGSRNRNSILDKINNLVTEDQVAFINALNAKCQTPVTGSTDNFVLVRQQCNNVLLSNMSNLVGLQASLRPMLSDIYKVLAKYDANKSYGKPSFINSYESADADLKLKFKSQQNDLKLKYNLFEVYSGLNSDLVKNMVDRQCNWDSATNVGKDVDRSKLPAINGWYTTDADSQKWYIETRCKNNTNSRVKARYYYNGQGIADKNKVANVLGVLVPQDYVYGASSYWMYNNTTSSYTSYRYISEYYSLNAPQITGVNNEMLRNCSKDTPVVLDGGTDNSCKRMAGGNPYGALGYAGASKYSANVTPNLVSPGYNYNWVTFKDSAGYNYIMYLVLGGRYSNTAGYGYAYCMTADCSVNSDGYTLKYWNGPSSVNFFSKVGSGDTEFNLVIN